MLSLRPCSLSPRASLDRSVLQVGPELTSDPWFQATLLDAYCGFLTFFVWVAYKEPAMWRTVLWFVLIMTLGNIAMSVYVLLQLRRFDSTKGIESLLLRHPQGTPAVCSAKGTGH